MDINRGTDVMSENCSVTSRVLLIIKPEVAPSIGQQILTFREIIGCDMSASVKPLAPCMVYQPISMEVGLPPEAVLRQAETHAHTHTQSDGCATLRWWQVLISFQNSIFILCKHLRLALTLRQQQQFPSYVCPWRCLCPQQSGKKRINYFLFLFKYQSREGGFQLF